MAGSYWPFPGGEPVTNGLNLGSMLPAVLTGFLVSSGRSRFFTRRLLHGRLFARRSAWGKSAARAPPGFWKSFVIRLLRAFSVLIAPLLSWQVFALAGALTIEAWRWPARQKETRV